MLGLVDVLFPSNQFHMSAIACKVRTHVNTYAMIRGIPPWVGLYGTGVVLGMRKIHKKFEKEGVLPV